MIARASGLVMGVGRFSRPRKGVGVVTMPDAGLDTAGLETARCVEVTPDAGVLRLLVPGVAVGVFINRCCVVDRVELTR